MATTIPYKDKDGKIVSYQIQVFRGRDSTGKKLKPYTMSWKVPETYKSDRAIKKALDKAVGEFETECKRGEHSIDKRTFREYSDYVMEIKKRDNKKRTVFRYEELLKRINAEIGSIKVHDLTGEDINRLYLVLEKGQTIVNEMACPVIDFFVLLSEINQTQKEFCRNVKLGSKTLKSVLENKNVKIETAKKICNYLFKDFENLFKIVKIERHVPMSPQTIMHHHRLIHTILKQARKERVVTTNAAEEATPPKVQKNEAAFFEIEEIIAIRKALNEQAMHWRTATMLFIDTGARRGEIMGLKWSSVNYKDGTITIENNLQYLPGQGKYDETTKTEEIRILSISPQIMRLMKKLQIEQNTLRLQMGTLWEDKGYCFATSTGNAYHPNSLNNWLDKFSKKYGLPKIHPHKFRHSQASILYASNIDIVTISNRLGHSEVSTTQNIYAHIMKESDKKAQEAIASALYEEQA
jgi:integrase